MERGRSKDPGKQERLDNYKAQFKNGETKMVDLTVDVYGFRVYNETIVIYGFRIRGGAR